MPVVALHLANLFDYAFYKGVSEAALRLNLSEGMLEVCDPEKWVSEEEFLKVFDALAIATADPLFGLHWGAYLNLKALGFIVQLSFNASGIAQAVLLLQQYFNASFPLVSLSARNVKGQYVLVLSSKVKDARLNMHLLDAVYCFVWRELSLMLPAGEKPELRLPYAALESYKTVFKRELKQGKEYLLVFSDNILGEELNQKKVKDIAFLLPKFLQLLDEGKDSSANWSRQVRGMMLHLCTPELPNFDQLVAQFAMSKRSLQRKLAAEGTTFRKIADGLKEELAVYLSKGNKMKTKDIASILGYAEPSAYLHARKKWMLSKQ